MSKLNSRRGSLALVAVLLLALVVYLLLRLLGPSREQSTDDAYVHADFTLVAPKVAGFIEEVLVDDNQSVKAGQVLARIDARDYRTALAAAEADVLAAEARHHHVAADLERQQAVIAQTAAQVQADLAALTFASQELNRYQHLASQAPAPCRTPSRRARVSTRRKPCSTRTRPPPSPPASNSTCCWPSRPKPSAR